MISIAELLFPSSKLIFTTSLESSEVLERLKSKTEEPKHFRVVGFKEWEDRAPLSGIIDHNDFEVTRNYLKNGLFVPLLTGSVKSIKNGTRIELEVNLTKTSKYFSYAAYCIVVMLFIYYGILAVGFGESTHESFIPFLGLGFIFLLTQLSFKYELGYVTSQFNEWFKAELKEEQK